MSTRLDDLLHNVNVAAFRAIDQTLSDELDIDRKVWIQDKHLPALIPAIETAVKAALRDVYEYMPEALNVPPQMVERTRRQKKIR